MPEGRRTAPFGKGARLRRRCAFLDVQGRGRRIHSGEWVILALQKPNGAPRIGITVSSKVANAVGRNRMKRWVREAFRMSARDLPPVDLVMIARPGAIASGYDGARRAIEAARAKLVGQGGMKAT